MPTLDVQINRKNDKPMPWKIARDPAAPTPPAFHHPDRCMNCGHLQTDHAAEVGCTVEGGTKYIEDHSGAGISACSCRSFDPAPKENDNAAA